jgi:phosphopentomutase
VLDSAGIGALPDAVLYGDEGSNTLGNIYKARGVLNIPNLLAMGLGNIEGSGLPSAASPTAAYGRMAELTAAKDTTSGHWELAGLIMEKPFVTVSRFPEAFLTEWCRRADVGGWLGNKAASGTRILEELGGEHMRTGYPIVYTSADSVFQIAAHEDVIPVAKLYAICEVAREMLTGDLFVGRVIARPFTGEDGGWKRTERRRDYAVEPVGETILDGLTSMGQTVLGIGKIEDIFCGRGVTHVDHTTNNPDGIRAPIDALKFGGDAFIFTNLVDFDMLYGHRNDVEGYARALEYFDAQLPEIIGSLRPGDILYITADHGCDPTTPSTDHSREYVPVLAYGAGVKPVSLGTRATFADLGATVYDQLRLNIGVGYEESFMEKWKAGESFFREITEN